VAEGAEVAGSTPLRHMPSPEDLPMGKRSALVEDRLFTVGEVASTMRVSNMTVYRLIRSGQLAAVRVGKNYRIRESDVSRFLLEGTVKAEGSPAEGK